MQIYIHRNNQQLGPFTEAEIKAQLASGVISLQDHVWWQGLANWMPLAQSPLAAGLQPGAPVVTPPVPIPGAPTAPAYVASAQQASSGLAMWSLVCGCLALLCGLLASIPAIVLGHLALGAIKKDPNLKGRGMALAGLIIGYAMTVLNVVVLTIYLLFLPTILKAVNKDQNSGQTLTVPDQSTNSPDQTTNGTDQTTNSTDQSASTNSDSMTNSPDQSTNSPAPSTNSTDSTNSAPMSNQ